MWCQPGSLLGLRVGCVDVMHATCAAKQTNRGLGMPSVRAQCAGVRHVLWR